MRCRLAVEFPCDLAVECYLPHDPAVHEEGEGVAHVGRVPQRCDDRHNLFGEGVPHLVRFQVATQRLGGGKTPVLGQCVLSVLSS